MDCINTLSTIISKKKAATIEEAFPVLEEIDECSFEYYFDSRWDFPKEAMQQMTDSIKDTKGLYIKVLSIEECNYYAAFNVFEDSVWVTK